MVLGRLKRKVKGFRGALRKGGKLRGGRGRTTDIGSDVTIKEEKRRLKQLKKREKARKLRSKRRRKQVSESLPGRVASGVGGGFRATKGARRKVKKVLKAQQREAESVGKRRRRGRRRSGGRRRGDGGQFFNSMDFFGSRGRDSINAAADDLEGNIERNGLSLNVFNKKKKGKRRRLL